MKFSEVVKTMHQRFNITATSMRDSQGDSKSDKIENVNLLDKHEKWGMIEFAHKDAQIEFLRVNGGEKMGWFKIDYSVNKVFERIAHQFLENFCELAKKKFPDWKGERCSTCVEGVHISWEECIELTQLWINFQTKTEGTILKLLKQLQSTD